MGKNQKTSDEILLDYEIWDYCERILHENNALEQLNKYFFEMTRIDSLFQSKSEFFTFRDFCQNDHGFTEIPKDFGDFQTPIHLTEQICSKLNLLGVNPDVVIEPMCGMGNFVVSSIRNFPSISEICAIDIQPQYKWRFVVNLINNARLNTYPNKIKIFFEVKDFFKFDFVSNIADKSENLNEKTILIIGNPPWITNTQLSKLNSSNIPNKSNIKKFKGLEAVTGKSNFDIAESMVISLIQKFNQVSITKECTIAMLCKTSVMRNIIRDAKCLNLSLYNTRCYLIDTKKEFNIAADAGLLIIYLGSKDHTKLPDYRCRVYDFSEESQRDKLIHIFGYTHGYFVSDIQKYKSVSHLEGKSFLNWRQGVKHDAKKIFEIIEFKDSNPEVIFKTDKNRNNASSSLTKKYFNYYGEEVILEKEIIFPLIKSSDIKQLFIDNTNRSIIITQRKIGQDTSYIQNEYPLLWEYLNRYRSRIDIRKSRIYKNKPPFSIFGIGTYAFDPYKVAISGFYKNPQFALVLPIDGRPIMLDDTCYYLSFKSLQEASIYWIILNSELVQSFLEAVTFRDAKRPYTKEKLMRINLNAVFENLTFQQIKKTWRILHDKIYPKNIPIDFSSLESEFNSIKQQLHILDKK